LLRSGLLFSPQRFCERDDQRHPGRGQVKIAIEGQNAYILDDSGKEIKRPIVSKIAEPTAPASD
jgi:hypothetical protein